jgi:hypothetical protein
MSELDNIDPETLTPSQAASLFQSKLAEHQRNTGDDIIKAWATVRTLNPKLAAKMGVHDEVPDVAHVQAIGRNSDSSGIIKGPTPPLPYTGRGNGQALAGMPSRPISIPNEGNIEALGLPRDCSFDEFRAADLANAGASPRNSAAIFNALVKLQEQKGLSADVARDAASARYPILSSEVSHGGAGPNGEAGEVSRKAHLASSLAQDKPGHFAAAAMHQTAGEAQSKAGDTEAAEMHQRMASYHTSQANQSKKS